MPRGFKMAMLIFIITILVAVILVLSWALYQYVRSPLAVLRSFMGPVQLREEHVYLVPIFGEWREYHDYQLWGPRCDTIRFAASFPHPHPTEPLPVVIVLGGLEIGRASLNYIPHHGQNIIVAYEYPYSPSYWYEGMPLREIFRVRRAVLKVPAQVVLLRQWIAQQPWADSTRILLLGYSFGAMFVPATYALGQEAGIQWGPTGIIYGGTNIYRLLNHNMVFVPQPWRALLARLFTTGIHPVEPEHFLDEMAGKPFLIINGEYDQMIPPWSWKPLHHRLGQNATRLILPESHMHPQKPQLTRKLVEISRQWLLKEGWINP